MSKVNLVLADSDEWYADGLSRFLKSSCGSKLNVNVFTKGKSLKDFFADYKNRADILLIDRGMMYDGIHKVCSGAAAILSDSRAPSGHDVFPSIDKFQPGEKIISNIIGLYPENSSVACFSSGDVKKTGIVSVFSPQGGSGKTVISLYLSYHFAKMGLKTLYLNLESINSSTFFINSSNNGYGLSDVFFYLKGNRSNLAIRIDAVKSFDGQLSINYYEPAECSFEIDELTGDDIDRVLTELRNIGQFDMIVVDMDSILNRRNAAVLNNCDIVMLVMVQEALAKVKLDVFDKNVRKIASVCDLDINDKIIPLLNRYMPSSAPDAAYIFGRNIKYRIPYLDDIYFLRDGTYSFNPDGSMRTYVKEISGDILASVGAFGDGR